MRRLRYLKRLLSDLWVFARENKAWWIVPLVLVLLMMTVLIVASQTATPYVYTLF